MNKDNSERSVANSISVTSLEDDEKDIPTSLSSSVGSSLNNNISTRRSAERRSIAASLTSVRKSVPTERLTSIISDPLRREHHDRKVVGLGSSALKESLRQSSNDPSDVLDQLEGSEKTRYKRNQCKDIPLEDDEKYARAKAESRPVMLAFLGYYTSMKIFFYYLISLNTLLTVGLTVGLTFYWYDMFINDISDSVSGTMSWVLLGFAVITPLSLAFGMAFRRREMALIQVAKFRSFAFQLFLAHAVWDWGWPPKGRAASSVDWLEHADEVMGELILIADELCRLLTLPCSTKTRHRMTSSGRYEAARTAGVAYRLYDSFYTRRFVQLSQLSDKLKLEGLGASESSRVRQYERWMGDAIENLRMIKSYRTPQTLRSFARIFTSLMPPFFAPAFAQLAINTGSLAMGIIFAIITGVCLNALLEGVEMLEDPFVAFVTLDGVDVREELQVLHYQQLVTARSEVFPNAKPYKDPEGESEAGRISDDEEEFNDNTGAPVSRRVSFAQSKSPSTTNNNASSRRMSLGSMKGMSMWNLIAEGEDTTKRAAKAVFSHGDAIFASGDDDVGVKKGRESAYQLQIKESERG